MWRPRKWPRRRLTKRELAIKRDVQVSVEPELIIPSRSPLFFLVSTTLKNTSRHLKQPSSRTFRSRPPLP